SVPQGDREGASPPILRTKQVTIKSTIRAERRPLGPASADYSEPKHRISRGVPLTILSQVYLKLVESHGIVCSTSSLLHIRITSGPTVTATPRIRIASVL
ncbi:unnamed protein product, partial [Ectocarpus sp. 8 AP-2014]